MRHRTLPTATAKNRRRYFDRGIGVCAEWADYEKFRMWALANGWAEGLQLDRRNNDRGYEPTNCQWVSQAVNINNREVTVRLEAWGEAKLITEWLADPRVGEGVDYHVLYDRLYRGRGKWTPERAICTPRRKMRNNASSARGPRPAHA